MKNFKESLKIGEKGEELFLSDSAWLKFAIHLGKLVEKPKKITNREDQHHKGDFLFGNSVRRYEYIEIKTRDPRYSWACGQDLFIELSNTKEPDNGKELFDAWINKYSEDTYLFYQWTEMEYGVIKLMRPVIVFKPADLKKCISWIKRHKIKSAKNEDYFTNGAIIKLEKLSERIKVWRITDDRVI